MGDAMLSTPQKVLRDTLRGKVNSSTKDLTSPPPPLEDNDGSSTDEEDVEREMETRREALRQRGRESYAKRKESSIASTNTTPVSIRSSRRMGNESFMDRLNGVADDDDDEDDDEDVFFNESRAESRPNSEKKMPPPRKKRKSGTGDQAYHPSDDGTDTEEDDPYLRPEPGSGKRKASLNQHPGGGSSPRLPVAKTPPSRTKRMDSTSTANTVVSRFKEGSMRDRASAVPPQEIIGMLPSSSSPARPDDDHNTTMRASTSATRASNVSSFGTNTVEKPVAAGGSFSFGGLTSLIPFNPFRIVKDIKESWERQKRLHEAKERKKKLLRERKLKGLLAYEEFKRMGALQGYAGNAAAVMGAQSKARNSAASIGPIRVDYVQDYTMTDQYGQQVGRAFSTDESRPVSQISTASTKLRRRGSAMTASLADDASMKGMADSFYEGRGSYVDEGGNLQRYSIDSAFRSPSGNFSRRSVSKSTTPKSGRMAPPARTSQLPPSSSESNGGKFEDVKALVKKKSKVFAATFTGRGDDAGSSKDKREVKRQERLMKKVSNLEDQLDKARRELEGAIDIPPVPRVSSRKRILPVNTNAVRGRDSIMSARESIMSADETDEEEKTEVDEPTEPLSPVMSASFGGSFMAKTAEMTIMESLDELENSAATQGNGNERLSSGVYGEIVLPKRVSKSNLGAIRRRRVSSGSGVPGNPAAVAAAGGLKHQGSLPVISSRGSIPPVPKFKNEK